MDNQNPHTSLEYENVNGIKLMLTVFKRQTSPKSRKFTITFKNVNSSRSRAGAKSSLFLAILLNLIAFFYIRISLTVVLVILISLSFLVYFWFTHSVQSGLYDLLFPYLHIVLKFSSSNCLNPMLPALFHFFPVAYIISLFIIQQSHCLEPL